MYDMYGVADVCMYRVGADEPKRSADCAPVRVAVDEPKRGGDV